MSHYEIEPPIYEKCMEKNECMRTKGMLRNGLLYVYLAFQCNMTNASTMYTQHES